MRAQPLQPQAIGGMDRGEQVAQHNALAALFLRVKHDPSPIPMTSEQTPLLP